MNCSTRETEDITTLHSNTGKIQMLVVDIIGRGWKLWQKYLNPFTVIEQLIYLLCENGFFLSNQEGKKVQKNIHRVNITLIKKCLNEIGYQNSTLLVSILSIYVRSTENKLDSRIVSIRLLKYFVENGIVLDEHLPTIISNLVHVLDSTVHPNSREVSVTGGVSLITEVTTFLTKVMAIYPDLIAFHKGQQRIAVTVGSCNLCSSLQEPVAANSSNITQEAISQPIIMGFVYDLRSGTTLATLGIYQNTLKKMDETNEEISMVADTTTSLYKLRFSPSGKLIAGIIYDGKNTKDTNCALVIWKIPTSIMSLFQSFSIGSSSSIFSPENNSSATSLPSNKFIPGAKDTDKNNLLLVDEHMGKVSKLTTLPKFFKFFSSDRKQCSSSEILWGSEKQLSVKESNHTIFSTNFSG